jgi:hypothetical protein
LEKLRKRGFVVPVNIPLHLSNISTSWSVNSGTKSVSELNI